MDKRKKNTSRAENKDIELEDFRKSRKLSAKLDDRHNDNFNNEYRAVCEWLAISWGLRTDTPPNNFEMLQIVQASYLPVNDERGDLGTAIKYFRDFADNSPTLTRHTLNLTVNQFWERVKQCPLGQSTNTPYDRSVDFLKKRKQVINIVCNIKELIVRSLAQFLLVANPRPCTPYFRYMLQYNWNSKQRHDELRMIGIEYNSNAPVSPTAKQVNKLIKTTHDMALVRTLQDSRDNKSLPNETFMARLRKERASINRAKNLNFEYFPVRSNLEYPDASPLPLQIQTRIQRGIFGDYELSPFDRLEDAPPTPPRQPDNYPQIQDVVDAFYQRVGNEFFDELDKYALYRENQNKLTKKVSFSSELTNKNRNNVQYSSNSDAPLVLKQTTKQLLKSDSNSQDMESNPFVQLEKKYRKNAALSDKKKTQKKSQEPNNKKSLKRNQEKMESNGIASSSAPPKRFREFVLNQNSSNASSNSSRSNNSDNTPKKNNGSLKKQNDTNSDAES